MKEIFSNTKGSVSVALVSVAVFLFSFGVALWSYSVSSDHSQDAVSYAKDGYDGSEGEDEGDDGEDEDEDEEKDEKKDDDKDKQDDEKSDEKSESSGTSKVTKTSSAEEKKTDGKRRMDTTLIPMTEQRMKMRLKMGKTMMARVTISMTIMTAKISFLMKAARKSHASLLPIPTEQLRKFAVKLRVMGRLRFAMSRAMQTATNWRIVAGNMIRKKERKRCALRHTINSAIS